MSATAPDTDDKPLNRRQVVDLLREDVAREGSQAAWARKHGVPQSVVSATLSSDRDPSPQITSALGLMSVVRYIRARPTRHSA